MTTCFKCASPIFEKQKFCTNCGAKVGVDRESQSVRDERKKEKKHINKTKKINEREGQAEEINGKLTFWVMLSALFFVLIMVRLAGWANGFGLIYDSIEYYYGVTQTVFNRRIDDFELYAFLWFACINFIIIFTMKFLRLYRHFSPNPKMNYPKPLWILEAVLVVILPIAHWNLGISSQDQSFLYDLLPIYPLLRPFGIGGAAMEWAVMETVFFQSTSLFMLWILARITNKYYSQKNIKNDGD